MFWLGFRYQVPDIDTGEVLAVIDEEELYEAAQNEFRMWRLMDHMDALIKQSESDGGRLKRLWKAKKR